MESLYFRWGEHCRLLKVKAIKVAPLNSLDTWSIRKEPKELRPKAKCFLVAEGANTEYWYLEALASRLAKSGIPELIELKLVERTEDDRNKSHPRNLIEQASRIRNDEDGRHDFDSSTDRVVVLFDADIYRNHPLSFKKVLGEVVGVAQAAV